MQARDETYRCLDFSTTKRFVSRFSVQAYINYSGGNVREVVLGKFSDRSALSNVIHQCPKLSILRAQDFCITTDVLLKEIRIAQNLTMLSINIWINMNSFQSILEGCSSLHTFECEAIFPKPLDKVFTNLQCLKITESEDRSSPPAIPGKEFVSDITQPPLWQTLIPACTKVMCYRNILQNVFRCWKSSIYISPPSVLLLISNL